MEPRFILSKSKVLENHSILKALADTVSYSFKTNNDVGYVLRDSTDCMFSIHSKKSIQMLNCPHRLWFFAQGWTSDDIDHLTKNGVKRFVVDNQNDLNILLTFLASHHDASVNLLLRMRLKEHTIHTGKHFVYGMYSSVVKGLILKLKENRQIEEIGIHFHRKTQNISEWNLKYELEQSLGESLISRLDYINIGGGLPAKYKNYSAETVERIFEKIKELKSWTKAKIMIEPGRFIAAPAAKLEAEIVNIYDNNIVINCSVYNGAMDTFVSHIRLEVEGELAETSQSTGDAYTIKGITPDSIDIFRYRVYLKEPKIGDKIIFLNAGAYTYSTDFCGLEKIKTIIVD